MLSFYPETILQARGMFPTVIVLPLLQPCRYDGAHDHDSHAKAITMYWPHLTSPAIIVIDDWNFRAVRSGTEEGFATVGARVTYRREIRLTNDDLHTPVDFAQESFWNGMAVFVVEK